MPEVYWLLGINAMVVKKIRASETLSLRHKILRPNLSIEHCVYPGDSNNLTNHFGCFHEGDLIGIVSVYCRSNCKLSNGQGFQIRAMATCESVRRQGVGLKLLNSAEGVAYGLGANYIWANARSGAIGFYERAGYELRGNEFGIAGLGPHYLVFKSK